MQYFRITILIAILSFFCNTFCNTSICNHTHYVTMILRSTYFNILIRSNTCQSTYIESNILQYIAKKIWCNMYCNILVFCNYIAIQYMKWNNILQYVKSAIYFAIYDQKKTENLFYSILQYDSQGIYWTRTPVKGVKKVLRWIVCMI